VAFAHPTNGNEATPSLLTPEELVAMSFQHIKEICEVDAGMPVTDAVITVPEFWTQKERQALLDAAEIAGISVLSLVNENTAAAIQYGIDRKPVANETHRAIFYNMGSTSTKVSLAEFTSYPERGKKNKTVGQFEMLSVAYDETLGGQAFEVRIMDHLVTEANKMFHAKGNKQMDVRTNQRAMAKLRVAAVKAKAVLSANKDTPIFVSSLANDIDFKTMLSRDKFIELSGDLIDRAVAPLKRVLDDKNFTPADIDAILIIGGGVRIPAIQSALKEFIKRDLGQGLDGDESMALGAVFRAANLSTQFQVRKFGMIDVTPFPVGVRLANLPSMYHSSRYF
jgi:hypoxia up-regulated 1